MKTNKNLPLDIYEGIMVYKQTSETDEILQVHCKMTINKTTGEIVFTMNPMEDLDTALTKSKEVYDNLPISVLKIKDVRTLTRFEEHNIKTFGDLRKLSDEDMLHWRNFGRKSLFIVKNAVAEFLKSQQS